MIVKDYSSLIQYDKDHTATYIANCMRYTLDQDLKDLNEFNLLCKLVEKVGYELEVMVDYQWLCDIVADLYYDLDYGFRQPDKIVLLDTWDNKVRIQRPQILTKEDLENESQMYLMVDMIIAIYIDKYYG